MTTTVTQPGQGSLHIGFVPRGSAPSKKDGGKNPPGGKPVSARFSLLPEAKPRWSAFGASVAVQCFALTLLVTLPMLFPEKLVPKMVYQVVQLVAPPSEVPLPPPPPRLRPKLEPLPPPEPVELPKVAKLMAPVRPVVPKLRPKEVPASEPPKVEPVLQAANFDAPKSGPARPRPPVETGVMTTGSAAPATVNRPINQVQTGGFGDPNGLPGPGDPNKRANIARRGSPDLPGGPGYGNGTGGANGVRGTVASTGFGNGVAIPVSGGGRGGRGTVQQGGFADASVAAEAPRARAAGAAPATQPVEILAKPNPLYTEEARRLRLEGEVLVEVVFLASGQVWVVRVTRGLGHGLDEAAVRAAEQIRFNPAKRSGQPVDFPATVHIVFQLAY